MAPWIEIYASHDGVQIARAGMWVQIGLTLLVVALAFYLPSAARVLKLEAHHRDFSLSMEDVARAYRASHEADRATLFKMASEFDSVRERIQHMKEHPDLGHLEPEILELAGQMSHVSRDLADIYSDDSVARAKAFLKQRQEEVDRYLETLALAKKTTEDLRGWMNQLEAGVALARALAVAPKLILLDEPFTAIDQSTEADLLALLPELGFEVGTDPEPVEAKVVSMVQAAPKPHPTRPQPRPQAGPQSRPILPSHPEH